MKKQDLVTIVSVALSTATLTVLTFWSGPLEAGSEQQMPPREIAKPKLVSHGVEVTLAAAGGRTFAAGDEPAFDLEAVNTTGVPANLDIQILMTASSPTDAFSRVIAVPRVLWQQPQPLVLKPHETRIVKLTTGTKLPPNTLVSVALREAGAAPPQSLAGNPALQPVLQPAISPRSGVVALNFSTVTRAALRAPVS
jgi:hypothetical protein